MKALLIALILLLAQLAHSIELEGTTDALEIVTTTTATIDYTIKWANRTATALTTPGTSVGSITTATTTSVVAAPAASNWRLVTFLSLHNGSTTAANTVTVQVDRSAANREVYDATLGPGETLVYDGKFHLYTASGLERGLLFDNNGFTGRSFSFAKIATAVDTIGYHYNYSHNTGFPGAQALQAPGLNGFATDCSIASQTTNPNGAAQMGSHLLPDASGAWYLTKFGLQAALAGTFQLVDVLWYNTGIVVTTTTNQAITPVAAPARDLNGAANGAGVMAALYATTTVANAAAVSNTTISYTDQDGNAGNTGIFSAVVGFQAPTTAIIGTWMPFQLAAGDTGVRSIEGVVLGTSYVSGTLSLMLYRPLATEGVTVANYPSASLTGSNQSGLNPGVRVYNDTCFWLTSLGAVAVTLNPLQGGVIQLMDR